MKHHTEFATRAAEKLSVIDNRIYLVDSINDCAWSSYEWGTPTVLWYLERSDRVYVAYPDGTVSLLSRDEDEVAEFRMLWELER